MSITNKLLYDGSLGAYKGKKSALVIGVNNSLNPNSRETLQYAERDADEMTLTLRNDHCGFQSVNLLRGQMARTWEVQEAILNLVEQRTDEDFLLFYFSGHAQPMETAGGQRDIYLVTANFKEQDVKRSPTMHISFRWLLDMLYHRVEVDPHGGAGAVLIILDCCYAGNLFHTAADASANDMVKALKSFFGDATIHSPENATLQPPTRSRLVLTATGYNITAQEEDGHGRMTHWILKALRGEDTDALSRNGDIDIPTLHNYLKNKIAEQHPNLIGEFGQHPWVLASYPNLRMEKEPQGEDIQKLIDVIKSIPEADKNFDAHPCLEASFDDLDIQSITDFLSQERVQNRHDFDPTLNSQDQLRQMNLLRQSSPTNAAYLCLSKNPSRMVAGAYTRCTYWHGNNRKQGWQEDQEYRESLLDQYKLTLSFLKRNLHLERAIDSNGSTEKWEIPIRVLEEAIANALIHREYAGPGAKDPVHIDLFDDRIEIISPGKPRLPIEQFGQANESHARNPAIMHIFSLNKYVEKVGSGIQRMQDLMQDAHLPRPEFQLSPTERLSVIIRRPPSPEEKALQETQVELQETQVELQETQVELQQKNVQVSTQRNWLRVLVFGLAVLLVIGGSIGSWYYLHPDLTRVTNLSDNGSGSLRQAIKGAKAGSTITFDASLEGTILLTSGDLKISQNIIVLGPDSKHISISSGTSGYIISVPQRVHATFENLIFTHSTIQNSTFISNEGNLTLNDCIVSYNKSYNRGGGITNLGGTLILNNTAVTHNYVSDNGGGIYNWDGVLTLNSSTVSNNLAYYNGGGIFGLLGYMNINNSTVENNQTSTTDSHSSGGGSGGGITLLNSLLNLSKSSIIGNRTQGFGGGMALLGSQVLMTSSTITLNSAAQKGGGLAVENDSENGKPSYVALTNYQVADTSYINNTVKNNTAPMYQDTLGITDPSNGNSLIQSVSSNVIGSPAPYPSPPELSPQYKGAVDPDAFCQANKYQSAKIPTPYNPYILQCVSANNTAKSFSPQDACQWKTSSKDVMTRLADYYDPSSWQCYAHEKKLGPVYNLDRFCISRGYLGVVRTGKTAYNWKCRLSTGDSVGLSITNACQWFYGNTAALDSLVNFNTLDGWECWAPA